MPEGNNLKVLNLGQLCQGVLANTTPRVATCSADVRSFPKGCKVSAGGALPSREPNKLCAYDFLQRFEIIVPLASQRLTDHLRKIEVNSKLDQKSRGPSVSLAQEEMALCGKKEVGKAF